MDTKELVLVNCFEEHISKQLIEQLPSEHNTKWGETFIEFDNDWGTGSIKVISFDWGITLTTWSVKFNQRTLLKLQYGDLTPIDFIFINSGKVDFKTDTQPYTTLNSFRNIIVRYKSHSENTFKFKKDEVIKMAFIQVVPKKYTVKKNHNVHYLNDRIKHLFRDSNDELYVHLGNYNLQIADHISKIEADQNTGMIRTLMLEGHLNLILGLQLLEHESFIHNVSLPTTLSQKEIEKIEKACQIIKQNISEKINVPDLASQVMLSTTKLQKGIQLLHNKTVNQYIKEVKLLHACHFLKDTNYSVSEIVYRVGFNSRSYFSRIFAERFGMLPTKYRQTPD